MPNAPVTEHHGLALAAKARVNEAAQSDGPRGIDAAAAVVIARSAYRALTRRDFTARRGTESD